MITKYEIDFLSVKDADAILIHFVDDVYGERIIAIDAGRYSDGDIVSSFVEKYYKRNYIDIAVCTHCDDDHYGGFVKINMNGKHQLEVDIGQDVAVHIVQIKKF